MELYIKEYESEVPVKWYWPLSVRTNNDSLKQILESANYARDFARIVTDGFAFPEMEHYNIMLFDHGYNSALQEIRNENLKADIVIFLIHDLDIKEEKAELFLKEIENAKDFANGFLFLDFPSDIETWFNELLYHLSHNNSIVEAIVSAKSTGYLYFTDNIKRYSKLDSVVEGLRYGLKHKADSTLFLQLKYPVFGLGQRFSLMDLKNKIEEDPSRFIYDKGSYGATTIKCITEELYKQVNPDMFQNPESDKSYILMSAPPVMADGGANADFDDLNSITELEDRGSGSPPDDKKPKGIVVKSPRFLQVSCDDPNTGEVQLSRIQKLKNYHLKVRIGSYHRSWKSANVAFPDTKVFPDDSKSVLEIITIILFNDTENKVETTEIALPKTGDSTEAAFDIYIPDAVTNFSGVIQAVHKGRIIQEVIVTIPLWNEGNPEEEMTVQVEFIGRTFLEHLDSRTTFSSSVSLSNNNRLRGQNQSNGFNLEITPQLTAISKQIMDFIESAATGNFSNDLDADENQALVNQLTFSGISLYNNHLRKNNVKGPLQIIASQGRMYTPFEYSYLYPSPKDDATLCSNAKEALASGKCMNCFDHSKSQSDHICPFGFLCLSEVIERRDKRENENVNNGYLISREMEMYTGVLTVLKKTAYACTSKVEESKKGLSDLVMNSIKKNSHDFFAASNWKVWSNYIVKENPDSLILIVHVEKDQKLRNRLEIGNADFLPDTSLPENVTLDEQTYPLAIVIGCKSANVTESEFDIASQFINNGAGIVISSLIKIRADHAGYIVSKMVEIIKKEAVSEISFGKIMLRLRQQLLSEGMMAGLALTSYGDADWKIKV